MGKIERFEDILAWQKARTLVSDLYNIMNQGDFYKDYILKKQILSAAISIMLNIAEGFGRRTNKDFTNFLNISHGSTAEVQSALYVALDQHYVKEEEFKNIYDRCTEISKMIMGLIKYLKD